MGPGQPCIFPDAIRPAVISGIIKDVNTAKNFYGTWSKSTKPAAQTTPLVTGQLERGAHFAVRSSVGWFDVDSGPLYAARDPLFWCHLANLDRLWTVWLSKHNNLRPGSPWSNFMLTSTGLRDKNNKLRSIKTGTTLSDTKIVAVYDNATTALALATSPAVRGRSVANYAKTEVFKFKLTATSKFVTFLRDVVQKPNGKDISNITLRINGSKVSNYTDQAITIMLQAPVLEEGAPLVSDQGGYVGFAGLDPAADQKGVKLNLDITGLADELMTLVNGSELSIPIYVVMIGVTKKLARELLQAQMDLEFSRL
jgi:hypothetical protein